MYNVCNGNFLRKQNRCSRSDLDCITNLSAEALIFIVILLRFKNFDYQEQTDWRPGKTGILPD